MTVLLKPKEVAARLRISLSHAYELINSGKIASYRISSSVRVSEDDLSEYLESRRLPSLERPPRKPYTRRRT